MKKIYAVMALVILSNACSDSIAPDKNARHLGTTLTVASCNNGSFSLNATWADATYKAEFFANNKVVATVQGTNRNVNSGCVYSLNQEAFVRFTPIGDITRYLDVTDSRVITIK